MSKKPLTVKELRRTWRKLTCKLAAGNDCPMRDRPKVYISGMIAHLDLAERMETFGLAEEKLYAAGYFPINPFKNGLSQEAHWREHMRRDIALLVECDYIYMLKGWELSKGAKLELDVASSCGIEVLFEHDNKL